MPATAKLKPDTPQRPVWLILSHGFNMDGRAASQTITDKIPFLARSVEPVIISATTGTLDPVLEHHQLNGWAPSALKFDLRHSLRRRYGSGFAYKLIKAACTLPLLPFYVVERLCIHLENQWSWFYPAYRRGLKVIRARQPAVIYSTGGANSAHLAGYLLARKTGLPWIAEVHDPMIHTAMNPKRQSTRWAAWLEGLICRHADAAFWFTDEALARARARHPSLGSRGHVIIPGAESPGFDSIAYTPSTLLRIGHFGSLNPSRNMEVFFAGLAEALRNEPAIATDVVIEIYGSQFDSVSQSARDRLPPVLQIKVLGRLEHDPVNGKSGRQQVLEAMRQVDLLLLLHGTDAFCEEYIPSKLYEYLWTQRPVLALTWRNPMLDRMLEIEGHTHVVATDAAAVAIALVGIWKRWRTRGLPDHGRPSPYSNLAAVQQLLALTEKNAYEHHRLTR
jgi:hypothetical protein